MKYGFLKLILRDLYISRLKEQKEDNGNSLNKYDPELNKFRPAFNFHWKKIKNSKTGVRFWKNIKTEITQTVDPFSVTTIFESAILNNIAFLELFYQNNGNINLFDSK